MSKSRLQVIVLAAGKGTRMKSQMPKVLHALAGRSMLGHVLATAQTLNPDGVAVVVGPGMPDVALEARRWAPMADVYVQAQPLGTGNAVLAARDRLRGFSGDVLVLFGDTPLIRAETLQRVRAELATAHGGVVLAFDASDPTGYGRVLREPDGTVRAIREHKDATQAERAVTLCNSGVLGFSAEHLLDLLEALTPSPISGEYYLTDMVEALRAQNLPVRVAVGPESEMLGVNARDQLAVAETELQQRLRHKAMVDGVTMVAPDTVYLSYDTVLGQDVRLEPNVYFGPGVTVGDGVEIKANSHIEGATIGAGVRVGPFARLRPGARLGAGVHVGNFVEVKNAVLEDGAKANHLAYIGDGRVGVGANIGAGTIFCNYDGFNKHHTDVGNGAFVGSNCSLVAPVTIGDGAYVGSGSVITKDVASDALAVERAQQMQREGWALKFRTMMQRRKKS